MAEVSTIWFRYCEIGIPDFRGVAVDGAVVTLLATADEAIE
jgi:hypothetical protein